MAVAFAKALQQASMKLSAPCLELSDAVDTGPVQQRGQALTDRNWKGIVRRSARLGPLLAGGLGL